MALNFQRGAEAIRESATRKGGNFRPFIPQVSWREDGESKFILVLTDIEEVAKVLLHSFIPVGKGTRADGEEFTRYEEFISRRDPAIGESQDDLEDRLEREPKWRHMGVMVELEPIMENKRFKSFVVKTETYTRNTDDGEIEVTTPVLGLCTQSAITLWGPLERLDRDHGPLIELPIQITRAGKRQDTRYDIIPFFEKEVDLAPVIEYLDGISYLSEEDQATVGNVVAAEAHEIGQAQAVADFILTKRLEELADSERYEELIGPLELEDMPKNPWNKKQDKKPASRPARPARRSPRENGSAETTPTKNERFQALKDRVEAKG